MNQREAVNIDDLLVEWETVWLKNVAHQIHGLYHRRQLHDEFLAMLDNQDHPDTGIFRDSYHLMYIEAQVMVIRRQSDNDNRTLSLRRLIGQLERHRQRFTRDWYVRRWVGDRDPESPDKLERLDARFHLKAANEAFDRFTDEPGGAQLGGRGLQEDRERLLAMTDSVVRYANAVVAHAEREPNNVAVTYSDFHHALEHLGAMLRRYYLLVNQGGLVTATPTIQGDWKGPFRKALA